VIIPREIQAEGCGGVTILPQYIGPKRVLRTGRATIVRFETRLGRQLLSDWGELVVDPDDEEPSEAAAGPSLRRFLARASAMTTKNVPPLWASCRPSALSCLADLLCAAMHQMDLSVRSYHGVFKLTRAIADLACADALQYRPRGIVQ